MRVRVSGGVGGRVWEGWVSVLMVAKGWVRVRFNLAPPWDRTVRDHGEQKVDQNHVDEKDPRVKERVSCVTKPDDVISNKAEGEGGW